MVGGNGPSSEPHSRNVGFWLFSGVFFNNGKSYQAGTGTQKETTHQSVRVLDIIVVQVQTDSGILHSEKCLIGKAEAGSLTWFQPLAQSCNEC
jgi:hypothetical protein